MKELENNNVNQVIPVSEMDLQELAILINERYKTQSKPVIINTKKFNQEIKNKSPKWRYNSFLVLLNKFPRAWEYDYIPQKKGEKVDEYGDRLYKELNESLPVDIRNSGDEQVIRDYILQNDGKWTDPKEEWGVVKQVLPIKAKARLIKRLETLEKKKQNQELAEARKAGVDPFDDRPKFVVNKKKVDTLTDQQKNGRILLDVHMPLYQTSGNGCWSCSMQMLMQGRGVKNITQEDIRSYRPNYGKQMMQGEKFTTKHVIDKAFNTDDTQNVMDMGDAAVNLVPDSMLRTLDILKISDAETAMYKKFTPEEKTAYKKNAVELFKKTIRKVLTEDKSPLSITDGFHYVTIVGIDGNNMLVKSSTASPYDKEYPENIENYVTKLLEGRHKCQLVWMTDINLAKDNTHFYGVPSETLELNPDGTYKMPPLVINVAANENRAEQEYEGFRVRLYAGKEDTRNEQADRPLLVDGVVKVEQAYMPKKLNVEHLKAMAKERSDIEEDRLKNQTIELLGYDPTKKRPQKKKTINKDVNLRGNFRLDDIKPEDKRTQFADDVFASEKRKAAEGEKGDNAVDNREERTRDKMFNPFTLAVGKDKDVVIREVNERVDDAIGINKKNFIPDVDGLAKEYIWNKPGADIAFRLEAAMVIARRVLTAFGPSKAKLLKEFEERYAKVKASLDAPENQIKAEDNLSGFDGEGVVLPSGLKVKSFLRKNIDKYDAVMLLDSISTSVSLTNDLGQVKLTPYTADNYDPSAMSRAVENMQFLADYQSGNLLRAAGKNEDALNAVEAMENLPDNATMEELCESYSSPRVREDLKEFIGVSLSFTDTINEQYKTADQPYVGPILNISIDPINTDDIKIDEKADDFTLPDAPTGFDGPDVDDILGVEIPFEKEKPEKVAIELGDGSGMKINNPPKFEEPEKEPEKEDNRPLNEIIAELERKEAEERSRKEAEEKEAHDRGYKDVEDNIKLDDIESVNKLGILNGEAQAFEDQFDDEEINEEKPTVEEKIEEKPPIEEKNEEKPPVEEKKEKENKKEKTVVNIVAFDKKKRISMPDDSKRVGGSRFVGYTEFTNAMKNAGLSENTANAIYNIYNPDMLAYVFALFEVGSRAGESVVPEEMRILALRGISYYAGDVKGRVNKDSIAHIRTEIYRRTRDWEATNGRKFAAEDHKDYGFNGKIGSFEKEEKKQDEIGEFPFEEEEKSENKEEIKPENIEEKKEDKGEEKPEDKSEGKKEESFDFSELDDEKDKDILKEFEVLVNDEYKDLLINGDNEDEFTDAMKDRMNKELDLNRTAHLIMDKQNQINQFLIKGQFNTDEEAAQMLSVYRSLGASDTRPIGVHSLFTIWAMGEMGYSFQNAIRLLDNMDEGARYNLGLFNEFCRNNQISTNVNDPEKYKEAVKNWARVFSNAAKKMGEYKIPDMDYSDVQSIHKIQRELFMIDAVGVNAVQDQISKFFTEGKCTTDTAHSIAMEELGGEQEFMEMANFWVNIQNIAPNFQNLYTSQKYLFFDNKNDVFTVRTFLNRKIYEPLIMRGLNSVRGKTLAYAANARNIEGYIDENSGKLMYNYEEYSPDVTTEDLYNYAIGANRKIVIDKVEAKNEELAKNTRKDLSVVFHSFAKKFVESPHFDDSLVKAFLNAPDDPAKRVELLKETDVNGMTYGTRLKSLFGSLTPPMLWEALKNTNNRFSSLFVIDGKSPEELWGNKYADIKNPEEREWLLRSEVLKTAISGSRDIQVKTYTLGKDNKYVEAGLVTMLPSRYKAEKFINGVEEYKMFVKKANYRLASYIDFITKSKEDKTKYSNLLDAITKIHNKLKSSVEGKDVSIASIKVDFAKLTEVGQAYVRKSKNPSSIVHIVASGMSDFSRESNAILSGIEKNISGNIVLKDGDTLENTSFDKASRVATRLKDFYSKSYDLELKSEQEISTEMDDHWNRLTKESKFKAVKGKLASDQTLTPADIEVLSSGIDVINTSMRLKMQDNEDVLKLYSADPDTKQKNTEIFTKAGFAGTRTSTMRSVCLIWMIGYKGFDVNTAIRAFRGPEGAEYIKEFIEFCKNNPMRPVDSKMGIEETVKPDKFNESCKNWAEVMVKSTDMVKNYTIPNIDYNDPEAVKEYYDEINIIKNLSIDFKQEFIDRLSEYKYEAGIGDDKKQYLQRTSHELMLEYAGGENAHNAMAVFWKGLQGSYRIAASSFFIENKTGLESGSAIGVNSILLDIAIDTEIFRQQFNKMKGMKLGEVPSGDIWIHYYTMNDERQVASDIALGNIQIEPDSAIKYLTGEKRDGIQKLLKEGLDPRVEKYSKIPFGAAVAGSFVGRLGTKFIDIPLFTTLEYDAQSVKEFIKTNKGMIDVPFEIINDDMMRLAMDLGIEPLDFILVDGKTPAEMWGEKYNDVQSPTEKNYLLKTELIKATLKGDHEIRVRTATADKNYNYKQTGSIISIPRRTDARKIIDSFDLIKSMLVDIEAKLGGYKNRLALTQRNPENNFGNDVYEGSTPYREMCFALSSVCYILSKKNTDEFNLGEFKRRLNNFQKKADAYYKRGKTSNPERLNVAGEASEDISIAICAFNEAYANINIDLAVDSEGTPVSKCEMHHIDGYIGTLADMYNEVEPMQRLKPEELAAKKSELISRSTAIRRFDEKMSKIIGKMPDTSKKLKTEEVAKLTVYNDFASKVKRAGITDEEITILTDSFTKDDISSEVSELANNKVFKVIAAKYQVGAVEKWNEILSSSMKKFIEYESFTRKHRGADAIKYIKTDKIVLTTKNRKYRDSYDRLGEVVAKQILSTPKNASILQGISAGQFEYTDLERACTEYLRRSAVLTPGNSKYLSDQVLADKLDSGTLKAEVLIKVAEPLKRVTEQRLRQQGLEKKNAETSKTTVKKPESIKK